MMINGLIGTHLATNESVEIPMNYKEMQLALDDTNTIGESWFMMTDMVFDRTGIEIVDQIELNYIVVNGVQKVFH